MRKLKHDANKINLKFPFSIPYLSFGIPDYERINLADAL